MLGRFIPCMASLVLALEITVAISGNTLAVGATNYNWGTVYIFINTGSGWTQAAQVTASTENTGFGGTLALSGNTLVVGEYNGNGGYGDTRIYTPSGSAWALNTTLSADTRANGNQFGESVAVSGNTVVVGEPWGKDGRAGFGDAYIYTYNNGWNEITNVSSPSPVGDGHFGTSVGISGNTIVIGETGGTSWPFRIFRGCVYLHHHRAARSGTSGERYLTHKRFHCRRDFSHDHRHRFYRGNSSFVWDYSCHFVYGQFWYTDNDSGTCRFCRDGACNSNNPRRNQCNLFCGSVYL